MALQLQIVFDCANPDKLANFWADVLGYKIQDPPQGYASWPDFLREQNIPEEEWDKASAIVDPEGKRPRIFFQRVPEPKIIKNRVHLDVKTATVPSTPDTLAAQKVRTNAEAERIISLGAQELQRVDESGEYWIVLADPEGNEFCVQ